MFALSDPDELKEAVERVDTELRQQYLIGYYPADGRLDGRYHAIRVVSAKRSLIVRARPGYVAEP
jgi:hypothetical protein